MTKVIMNGCNGHMGHVISDLCEKDPEIEIVAGIDINTEQHYGYPVFASIGDCDMTADAIIDFSHVSCIDALMAYCVSRQIPVVVCTTGLSGEQDALLKNIQRESRCIEISKYVSGCEYFDGIASDGCKGAGSGRI